MTEREDLLSNEARLYCQQVQAGSKPVASMQLHNSCLKAVLAICTESRLRYYCTNKGLEETEFSLVFIYKHKFLEHVIEHSLTMTDANPVEIFFRGCMYGYGINEIAEYIEMSGKP